MITSDLEAKLLILDYTRAWIDVSILTEAALDDQILEFATAEDSNKEHYRYRTLTNYLKRQGTFSDTQIEQIAALLHHNPDEAMASSALISVLKMPILSNKQFGIVKAALARFGSWTEKHIDKQQTVRSKENASD